jgi:hypothetical protein
MLPNVAVIEVPALTAPAVALIFPVVAVTPVPPVTVVVADRLVVVVKDPGAVIAEGKDTVAVDPDVVTVTWFVVPFTASIDPVTPVTHVPFPL